MRQRDYTGPRLPKQLLDRIESSRTNGRKSTPGRHAGGRQERRKAEREQRKAQRVHSRQKPVISTVREGSRRSDGVHSPAQPVKALARPVNGVSQPLKSILKRTSRSDKNPSLHGDKTPETQTAFLSRREKETLERDDEEILALEKKLSLKGSKKLPKAFEEDGLDSLLEGLVDGLGTGVKRKRADDDEWLKSKRRRAENRLEAAENDEDEFEELNSEEASNFDADDFPDSEDSDVDQGDEDDLKNGLQSANLSGYEDDLEDAFDGFESDTSNPPSQTRIRENPYVAPGGASQVSSARYIAPSLRAPPPSDAESMARLRRQTQGLLNRLSEANLTSILQEVEKLYQSYPRGYVTSTLIELLLGIISDRTSLMDTFLILHAGFIAAIYKVIGQEFAAQLIERVVEKIDRHYGDLHSDDTGKQAINLISLLAELYNFQVVGSNLIFDYIRLFLHTLSELNTELILRIVRTSGPQLRGDDPTALKSIVQLLQNLVSNVDQATLSVRTKSMLETITSLKNNRMKTGAAASAIVSEHTVRMKKLLGSLNTRSLKATEPLRIGLADLQSKEKRGKWWLIGASFRDSNMDDQPPSTLDDYGPMPSHPSTNGSTEIDTVDGTTTDLHALAIRNRMNTPIRLTIFLAIMSATDYKDAHMRLMKLHLKRAQEREIPRVLLHCAGMEAGYNPYYTLIAKKLCGDRRLKMGFQFGLWDLFRQMGEKADKDDNDMDDEDEERDEGNEEGPGKMSTRKIVNLARLYGNLIVEDALSMSVFKILSFTYIQPKTSTFLEILLITVILQSQKKSSSKRDERALLDIVMKVQEAPQMARGLQYFLKKVVSGTDIAGGEAERETVRWGCKIAVEALDTIVVSEVVVDD